MKWFGEYVNEERTMRIERIKVGRFPKKGGVGMCKNKVREGD